MFFLGVLGVIQTILLPGLIFNRLVKPKGGIVFQFSTIFLFSLLLNFLVVTFLTEIHLYTRTTLFVLIAIEFLLILYLYRNQLTQTIDESSQKINQVANGWKSSFRAIFLSEIAYPGIKLVRTIILAILMVMAISLCWWFFKHVISNAVTVFSEWDSVLAWNTWAQTWAQNKIPENQTFYPQLIPINLSIPYVLIDNIQVSFFSKSIMPLFSVLMALLLFEAALEQKRYGYFIGIIVLYFLIKKFLGSNIGEAYVDLPLAFVSLLAIQVYSRTQQILNNRKELFLVMVIAATGVVTKQPAAYLLVVLAVLVLLDGIRNKASLRWFLIVGGISGLIVLVGYSRTILPTLLNFDQTGLPAYYAISTDTSDSSTLAGHLAFAINSLGKYAILYVLLIPGFFILPRKFKLLIVTLVIPFTVLWAVFASYDVRNLSLVFPLLAIISGLTLEKIGEYVFQKLDRWKLGKIPTGLVIAAVLIGIFVLNFLFSKDRITAAWQDKQRLIFSPNLNEQIDSLDFSGSCQKVLTSYPIRYLPGHESHEEWFFYNGFDTYTELIQDPAICWILVPPSADAAIQEQITANLDAGKYQLIFTVDDWIPYRLIKIR
ncbi:MAG TPA: hypothetical protein VIH16_12215 [Bellilinea sp.]